MHSVCLDPEILNVVVRPDLNLLTDLEQRMYNVFYIPDALGSPYIPSQRLFDPFFTTKPVGKGTGLGLSISYQIIVEQHRGKISCISVPEQGTEFVIKIPVKTKNV